jgi:teichuronic acid exporter
VISILNVNEASVNPPVNYGWGKLLIRGIAWNTLYQFFQVATNFVAMLVLVRIIPPTEYGRATTVVGLLTFLNALNSSVFMSHALQLTDGAEPDWTLHWSVGFYIQFVLGAVCHCIAAICWFYAAYRPIAPLLHIAAVGLLLDAPNQLRMMMLRRAMNFRRLRILSSVATLVSTSVVLSIGVLGGGAYSIVLSSNLIAGLPFGIDLFFIQRWRPRHGWLTPNWTAYRPAFRFGLQQAASAFLSSARGMLEAVFLPPTVGFVVIGLWSRAQSLYTTSVGRLTNILLETVYPVLPRYAADIRKYRSNATLLLQAVLWIALPGGLYLGIEGHGLSRLVYGVKWIAADPLILPSAVAGTAMVIFIVSVDILLANNRLRTCLLLEAAAASLAIASFAVVWLKGGMVSYAWAAVVAQTLAAAIAVYHASRLLALNWFRLTLLPAAVGTILAVGVLLLVDSFTESQTLVVQLMIGALSYASALLLVYRFVFPKILTHFIDRMPGALGMKSLLRLSRILPDSV